VTSAALTTSGFLYGELSPGEVLEVLANLGEHLHTLRQRGTRIVRLSQGALGTYSGIFVPDAGGQDLAERKLREVLQELRPQAEPRTLKLAEGQAMALDSAILWLLINSQNEAESAQPNEGEWLVVAPDLGTDAAAKLAEDLRFHSTAMYLAPSRTRSGNQIYLFHLKADTRRKSSFQSFVVGGGLHGGDLLAAFDCQGDTIFLPVEHAPSRRALAAFRRIILLVPQLLGVNQVQPDDRGRLLAIVLRTIDGQVRANLLILSQVAFVDQIKVAPAAVGYVELEVEPLQADERAVQALRKAVAAAEPQVGYRLELRRSSYRQGSDREIRRLSERLADLRHRLSYARSLQRSYPRLLRFSQRQVPALADAIRCFPMETLSEGLVTYGFQASTSASGETKGWHFLLFDSADAKMREPYPPWQWLDLGSETRFFWLDPLWAEHSFDQGTASLVFVPKGLTLFPTLHAWQPEEIDSQLCKTVSEWFPASAERFSQLRQPVYIFDGEAESNATIHLQVLDRQELKPLSETIGWINDHLVLHRSVSGAEELISNLARDAAQRELAEAMRTAAEESRQRFAETAQQVNQAIAAEATELLEVMTREVNEIAKRCRQGEAQVGELVEAMQTMEETVRVAVAAQGKVEREITAADRAADRRLKLLAEVERKLSKGSAQRDALARRTAAEIDKQKETEVELRQRLRRPRRRRRG
jgi:hypothetical protein